MVHVKIKNNKYIFILAIFCFAIPITLFGIKDREDYDLGLFSAKIISSEFNFFIFFYDLYGPGVKFPLGQGLFFHPLIFLLFEIKFFYFIFIIINIFIQINYFSKILKQFKILNKGIIPTLLLIFSISNFNYIYSDDWISVFFSYSLLFPTFYYLNKILNKKKDSLLGYIQFTLSMSFMVLNGHLGIIFNYFFFFFLYIVFNKKYYFFFKTFTYIFFLILIIILSEYFYWLIEDYLSYNTSAKSIQPSYSLKNYLHSLISPLFYIPILGNKLIDILELNMPINRLPFYGFFFFISFVYGGFKLIKKKSSEINFLNYLLFIITILSLTDKTNYLYIISGIWLLRDVINLISIILIAKILNEIKSFKLLKFLISFFSFLLISIFFCGNITTNTNLKTQSANNFIVNNPENNSLLEILKKIKIYDNQFDRIYFGPDFYNIMNDKKNAPLKKYGIYGPSDFLKFNLISFNVPLKNSSLEYFNKATRKMYSENKPLIEDINNKLFLNIFKIKYLLISSKEYQEIKNKNFFLIVDEIKFGQTQYFILKNQTYHLSIIVSETQINNIDRLIECKIDLRKCINKINQLNLYSYSENIEIKREGLNKYIVINKSPNVVNLITPFIFNENWNTNENTKRLGRYLQIIKISSNQKELLEYFDQIRFILKFFSITLFFILIIVLIKLKLNFFKSHNA